MEEENEIVRLNNKLFQYKTLETQTEIRDLQDLKEREQADMKDLVESLEQATVTRSDKEKVLNNLKEELEKGKSRQDYLKNEFNKLTVRF